MSGLFINISLIILGTICAVAGISFYCNEKNNPKFCIIMLFLGLLSFFWCAGYALMGLSTDIVIAFIGRTIGLFGVIFFLVTEFIFLAFLSIKNTKHICIYSAIMSVFATIDFFLFSSPTVLEFTTYNGRTCYYATISPYRIIHNTFVVFCFLSFLILGILWGRKPRYRREKKIFKTLLFSNLFLVFTSLCDTILPMWNLPSFPASCYGSVVVCISLWFVATRMNAFSISFQNLSSYLFKDINTSLLIFHPEGKLALYNDHAKNYLGLDSHAEASLHELFEITEIDANTLMHNVLLYANHGEYRLKPRFKNAVCSLIFNPIYDQYHDPYCVTCSVYDLTKEEQALKEIEEMKQHLQADVREKSYEIERLTLQAITTIANTIDAKDAYTKGHSIRVSEYSALLAEAIGWDRPSIQNLKYIALLHDIGKIGVPDNILCKPSRLTDVEFALIKSHTKVGGEILKDITMIPHVSEGAKYHHERYDGKGYPCGLKGEEIPLIARIICIADCYDAMSSKRIYRNPLDTDYIINEFKKCRGTQFDPYLTDRFLELLSEGKVVVPNAADADNKTLVDESAALLNQIMKNLEQENRKSNDNDYLTGLLNRTAGEPLIIDAMQETSGCLYFADLDNLKTLNDRYGHLTGDHALTLVAEVLKSHTRNSIIARIGGDEFLCFVKNVSVKEAEQIATSLLHAFRSRKSEDENLCITSLSIGLCMTTPNDSYKNIYQNTDKALYHVKQNGKDGYYFFNQSSPANEHMSSIDLTKLVDSIIRQGSYKGALDVGYREFTKLYDYISNLVIRYNHSIELIMITVTSTSDLALEQHEEAMNYMNQAIRSTLRNVDINTRFSSEQFLVILVNADKDHVQMIVQRIFDRFFKMYGKTDILCNYERADISPEDLASLIGKSKK